MERNRVSVPFPHTQSLDHVVQLEGMHGHVLFLHTDSTWRGGHLPYLPFFALLHMKRRDLRRRREKSKKREKRVGEASRRRE